MHAIELENLSKRFGSRRAVDGLTMTVPEGAIYGFIGENGSGKSTTEKLICGLLVPDGGTIRLFGRAHTDPQVRSGLGVLIEAPGCFPNCTVWNNMMLQAANLGLKRPQRDIQEALKLVRMEGAAGNKYKNCSLGMKQRLGIAMALLGRPRLLVLDEPVNGLDADGMRILRTVLVDLTQSRGCTVLISSHILGELEKIATHYGILRQGRMLQELTAGELEARCPTYVALETGDMAGAMEALGRRYDRVTQSGGQIRVYGPAAPEEAAGFLYEQGFLVTALKAEKISLEEYYTGLMHEKEGESYGAAQ